MGHSERYENHSQHSWGTHEHHSLIMGHLLGMGWWYGSNLDFFRYEYYYSLRDTTITDEPELKQSFASNMGVLDSAE